jgi:hypothetical protein
VLCMCVCVCVCVCVLHSRTPTRTLCAQLPPTVVKTKGRDPFDSSANEFRKK